MAAKHTPGPWKAAPYSSVVGCPVSAQPDKRKNTFVVAGVHGAAAEDDDERRLEVEANARLIAAAPELLDLAKLFARTVVYYAGIDEKDGDDEGARLKRLALANIEAVIAKAEGREVKEYYP
jgi:hypothetical protein